MKIFVLAIFVHGLGIFPAFASSDLDVIGVWQYDGFIFEGHRYPKSDPNLELTFTFDKNGHVRLFWERKNEGTFCESRATFQVDGERLMQKVIWVNPKNAIECSSDPDMRVGKETDVVISISNSELTLHLDVNGKPFLYILKRMP